MNLGCKPWSNIGPFKRPMLVNNCDTTVIQLLVSSIDPIMQQYRFTVISRTLFSTILVQHLNPIFLLNIGCKPWYIVGPIMLTNVTTLTQRINSGPTLVH